MSRYFSDRLLDITYQLMINGSPAYSNGEMSSFGISFISESLTNPTGDMGRQAQSPAKWCLATAAFGCARGQLGSLGPNGQFTDILGGQGTLTQSFLVNGAGAPLQVVFQQPAGIIGPPPVTSVLNNTYNSLGHPPSVTVAGGALTSNGKPSCN